MTTENTQEFLPAAQPVAAFDEFRSRLAELQVGNSKAVFDYRSPKGNKEARSHIDKLRTTKAAIEKKRVSEKEEFLTKGRLVDADARELKLKEDVEKALKLAAEKAERDRLQSIEDERAAVAAKSKLAADIKAKEDAEAAKLAANQNHRKAINKDVTDDLINLGCTRELAINIVKAMMNKDIRHCQINY